MYKHFEVLKRNVKIVNLDPAAEYFEYPVTADIRDLIQIGKQLFKDDYNLRFILIFYHKKKMMQWTMIL
jgi:GPN-loop GTPase